MGRLLRSVRGPRGSSSDRWGAPFALPLGLLSSACVLIHGLLLWRFPLFLDESIYARFALIVERDTSSFFIALSDKKGLLVSWIGALLVEADVPPLTAIRLVSAAAGLLTIILVALIGRELYGRAVGLAAAAVALVLPLLLVHTAMGVYDPTVTAMIAAALLLQIRLARRARVGTAVLLALALAAGILTKPSAYVAVVLLPASLLLFEWPRPDRARRLARWGGCVVIGLAGVVVAEAIMRSSSLYFANGPANTHGLSDVAADPIALIQAHWPSVREALAGYVTVPLVLAGAFGAVTGLLSDARRIGLLLIWTAVPLVAALLIPYDAYSRYLLPMAPAFVVVVGYGVTRAWTVLSRIAPRVAGVPVVATAMIVVVLTPALLFDLRVAAHPRTTHYPGLDEAGFVRGATAAAVVADAAAELRRRSSRTRPVVYVGHFGGYHDPLEFSLNGRKDARHPVFVVAESPPPDALRSQQFVVLDGVRPPAEVPRFGFTLVGEFPRPHGGIPVLLYERR